MRSPCVPGVCPRPQLPLELPPKQLIYMVLPERFELSASPLPRGCSTPELRQRIQSVGCSLSEPLAIFNAHSRGPSAAERAFWTACAPCGREGAMPARKEPPQPPKPPGRGRKPARLAEALRANLARRKAQRRARAAAGQDNEEPR